MKKQEYIIYLLCEFFNGMTNAISSLMRYILLNIIFKFKDLRYSLS